jgi:hypothetical protein
MQRWCAEAITAVKILFPAEWLQQQNSKYLTNKASNTEDRFVLLWGCVLTAVLLTLVLKKQQQLTCIACLW